MKKLNEFTVMEVRTLLLTLAAELSKFKNDEALMSMFREYVDAQKGKETTLSMFDIILQIIDSLFAKNEASTWIILSAITQRSIDEVKESNNVEVIEAVADFFSTKIYRELFTRALKLVSTK